MDGLGYDCVVQRKPHDVKLCTFYRRSRLALQWSEERSRALLTGFSLPRLVSSIPLENEERMYVVNVHLEGSPWRGPDRVAQVRHALQRLEHHISTAHGHDTIQSSRIIIAGDFNSISSDAPATFLRERHLEAGHRDDLPPPGVGGGHHSSPNNNNNKGIVVVDRDIAHPFHVQEVYEYAQAVPPFTRKVQHRGGARLDFVWTSVAGFEVVAVMRPVPMEHRELIERVGLPNYALPSDHLPVGAVLRVVETSSSSSGGGD